MKKIRFILPFLVFLFSFGVYIFTLSPSITAGDSTEMTTAALTLGIPHQPSYPLNTILGHLFSRLPFGPNPIWRINLMAAFFEALACLLIYFVILKLYKTNRSYRTYRSNKDKLDVLELNDYLLAASASLFLALSLNFWHYGTKAEVFALNNFFIALLVLTTLIAVEKKNKNWFFLLAFLAGLAFTHHQTIIFVGPPLLYLVVSRRREVLARKEFWLKGIFFAFLGFLPYYLLLTQFAKADPLLNWGNPTDLAGVLRALKRSDFGTFSAYLRGLEEKSGLTPIDQIVFYLKSLIFDFTILGVILAAIGVFWTFKEKRSVFNFLILGLGSGVAFLAYANFPLADSFNQATTKRFQLLPDFFFVSFLAFGLLFLWQKFLSLKLNFKEKGNLFAGGVVFFCLIFAFLIPLLINFPKANNRGNFVTLKYALDFYLPTEPNAIIMLSGDVPNFAASFIKTVELEGDERIVFTPGQFHLDWFIPQLTSRHPGVVIPPPLPGKRWTTTSQVIRANLDKRPIYISPELVFYDPEVEKEFVLWPKNLLFQVRRKGGEEKLESYQEISQRLWQSLDLDWLAKIRKNKPLMEEVIIGYYSRHFHNLGYMYDSVKLYEDAIREYERAAEIDPYLAESLKNLGLIYGMKLEPRDYQKGVEYLSKFISLVEKDNPELADSARYTIAKIMEDQAKETERLEEEAATVSAEQE